jgi:hypothetical protein
MQKLFIVEDSPLVLKRLTARISALPHTQVVGHAAGADEAVRAIVSEKPDIVVLDLKLAQGTGFDVYMIDPGQWTMDLPDQRGKLISVVNPIGRFVSLGGVPCQPYWN